MQPGINVKIVDIIFVEVPPQPQMYHRPYEAKYNDTMANMVDEVTRGGADLSSANLASISGTILRPSAQVGGQVGIANGFGQARFVWNMILLLEEGPLMSRYELVSGYTADNDVTLQKTLDKRMRMFINNTTLLNHMRQDMHNGSHGTNNFTVSHSTQVLTPIIGWDSNNQAPIVSQNAVTTRPSDVFVAMGSSAGMENAGGLDGIGFPGQAQGPSKLIHDGRVGFASRAKRSLRQNGQNNMFLNRFLTSYKENVWGAEGGDLGFGMQNDVFANAAAHCPEPLSVADAFLKLLTERTGFASEWSIEWNDIIRFDPTLETRRKVHKLSMEMPHGPSAADTVSWNDVGHEVQVAQLLVNVMPAIMSSMSVGFCAFTLTNLTADGSCVAVCMPPRGLTPAIDVTHQREAMEFRLAREVMPQLSNAGMIRMNISAQISLISSSLVEVQLDGGVKKPYRFFSGADALTSPVQSNDESTLSGMAFSLGMMAGDISRNAPRPQPSMPVGTADMQYNLPSGNGQQPSAMNAFDIAVQKSSF